MPQFTSIECVVQAQKIKERPTLLPDMAVPATDIGERRLIDEKRWMTILTIVMTPAKRTTSHPSLIKADIFANHGKCILCGTPVPNSPCWLNCCGRLTFF